MRTKQATITINVFFSYDENRTDDLQAAEIAAGLTIRPNFNTIDDGVQVIDHEITEIAL